MKPSARPASLDALVEWLDLGLEILHPGGLQLTRELADQCGVTRDTKVLDVASGTGESACFLTRVLGARVVGIDASDYMVRRAQKKAERLRLHVDFMRADAHALPFAGTSFDAAISECTTCILDKLHAIQEMTRVVRPGGFVGIHDLCWHPGAPVRLQEMLVQSEGERPETLEGWCGLFRQAGLTDVVGMDRSFLMPAWMRESCAVLGWREMRKVTVSVIRRWGLRGVIRILNSERVFRSPFLGYGIVAGRKPPTDRIAA